MALTLAVAAKLHENQLERHLELFERMPQVERVFLVRRGELSGRLRKLETRTFAKGSLPLELVRFAGTLDELLSRERIDWVVGFNPVPWGSLAWAVARRHQVPCCLSLIGLDYLQLHEAWAFPFRQAVARAQRITVTGRSMKEGLKALGVDGDKVTILPHSVDLDRFAPRRNLGAREIIAVGQLIARKRMDVLIDAVALCKERGKPRRLTILGRGPLEAALRAQVQRLGVEDWVEFVGHVDNVEEFLAGARVFSLASHWEGVPFALMEAMAAGLIPVITDVGTIADWVRHEHNGLVVNRSAEAFADHWERALTPAGETLRATLLAERGRLGLEQGVSVWQTVLGCPPS